MGFAYARRTPTPENLQRATTEFEAAYRMDETQKDVVAELGRLRVQAGDYRGAVTYLEKAWQQGPRTEDIAFNLAKAYRGLGDATRAAQMSAEFKRLSEIHTRTNALNKQLAVNPKDVDAAIELADLEVEAQNWEEAVPLIQTLLKVRPNDPRVLSAAARLYHGIGDDRSAKAMEERLAAQKANAAGVRK
jgi:Flp pilus assembly protein TadD